jgi:hypothetical protein
MDNRTLATGRVVVLDRALLLTQPGPSLLSGRDYLNVPSPQRRRGTFKPASAVSDTAANIDIARSRSR